MSETENEKKIPNHNLPPDTTENHQDITTPKETDPSLQYASGIDVENQNSSPDEKPRGNMSTARWSLVVAAILSSNFLFALDNTVVADVQPVIIKDLGNVDKLTWLSVSFLLGATATNLVWGKIYSQFNSKWFYIGTVALFEIGSAICGAAPSMNVMILGRALCGVSGSGIYVGIMTLLAQTTTLQERPIYIGGTGFTWGLGIVLGPIIGGAFSDSPATWRWAFYINLCVGAVFAPVYLFMIPSIDPRLGVPIKERLRTIDYIGIIITFGAFTSGILAISWGGLTYPWDSGTIIGLFVCSGVLFVILGLQQVFTIGTTKADRLIPIEFFSDRMVMILFAVTAASGAAAFIPIYMVPIFFQFARGDAALDAGVRLLPFIIVMIVFIFSNGALMSRFGWYQPWYIIGGILAVIGGALMYTVDETTSVSRIYGYTVLIGGGVGMFIQASFSVAQAFVSPEKIASAIGFITCAQFAGITIALAIANTVYLNQSETGIEKILPNLTQAEIEIAMEGSGNTFMATLPVADQQAVLAVIDKAIAKTYILEITAGALVVVLGLLMKRRKIFVGAPVAGGM